jgi:hypothetical protein
VLPLRHHHHVWQLAFLPARFRRIEQELEWEEMEISLGAT